MNKSSICNFMAGGLLVASCTIAQAEDKRICFQPFGYDPSSQSYQTVQISCENMEQVLRMNPGFQAMPTRRDDSTGEQFTQINDKDSKPIFGIYLPPRKQTQNPNS